MNDLERYRLRLPVTLRRRRCQDFHRIALLDLIAFTRNAAIQQHAAVLDPLLQPGTRDVGEQRRQRLVEPPAG